MSFEEELQTEVKKIFGDPWDETDTEDVPEPEDVALGNHAKVLDSATVLYADLDGSTRMVDKHTWQYSSEVYKSFLRCTARIIRDDEGGAITAYDGDRIMAVFVGRNKNTRATRAALKINYAVTSIINPTLKELYSTSGEEVMHVVGIDTSGLRAIKAGVRGDNDLTWVGPAANYAAKLTNERLGHATWITEPVYKAIHDSVKLNGTTNIWVPHVWNAESKKQIYGSTWWHKVA
jgi:class 3 adenylate cyclase